VYVFYQLTDGAQQRIWRIMQNDKYNTLGERSVTSSRNWTV